MIHITEKYDPLNTEEKITALFEELKNNGCVYSAELEVSILYKIRKAKLQIFLKGILKQLPKKSKVSTKGGTEKLSSPKKSFCDPSLWKKKKTKKKKKEKQEPMPIVYNYGYIDTHEEKRKTKKQPIKSRQQSKEEKFERNRDKRVERGFSSTGVPLPSYNDLCYYMQKREERRSTYYKNHSDKDAASHGKFYINVCMGGKNKSY